MEEPSDSNDDSIGSSSTDEEKLSKRVKTMEGVEDIMSKLPESLIIHIISFLPTKDAVRTSVLSRKWVNRWTSITKLDLDDSVFYSPRRKTGGKQYFMNFVCRALLLTKSPAFESLSIVITNKYDVSLFNTWMAAIFNRNVKNLCINSHFEVPFSIHTSHSFFDCEFLEELEMRMISIVKVPITFVHFGHLKQLKLYLIVFIQESSRAEDITLSLPVLKEFEIINCTWMHINSITLKAPLLESVVLEHDVEAVFYELDYLPIKISASRLTKVTYCSYCFIAQSIVLLDPSSAHNAFASVTLSRLDTDTDSIEETATYVSSLLGQFSEVKHLKFEGSELLMLSELDATVLPVYGMLSHLELGLVTTELLLALLQRSPVLKTLDFKGIFKFDKEVLNSTTVPHCFTSSLQHVKFGNVYGLEHELYLAKFFMENATVMERMSFILASHQLLKSKIIEEFKENLFSFKKGFSLAIVEFSFDD